LGVVAVGDDFGEALNGLLCAAAHWDVVINLVCGWGEGGYNFAVGKALLTEINN
jgi:hypothetical protein